MKFRIYDNQEKRYREENRLVVDSSGTLWAFGVGRLWNTDDERFIVEYSTGKKDSNEAEIYAGHIVSDADGYRYEVEWNKEDAMFCMNEISGCDSVDFKCARSEDFTIIGTIHEVVDELD